MKFAPFVLGVVSACNGPSTIPQDVPIDSRAVWPPPCNPPQPQCTTTCGNNQIDECYLPTMPGHCASFFKSTEPCDGTDVKSCTDLGYYGGTSACRSCSINDSSCDACAPSSTCGTYMSLGSGSGIQLAAHDGRVAILGSQELAVYESLREIIRWPIQDGWSVTNVPYGWLVARGAPLWLIAVDTDGHTRWAHPVALPATVRLTSGPTNRVLAVWKGGVGSPITSWHVYYAILDTDGNIVVQPTDLITVGSNDWFGSTSDGNSFFVGTSGKLARIAPDGGATIVNGFPMSESSAGTVGLQWVGTSGWYISWPKVQRFDAMGSFVGNVFTWSYRSYPIADGADLLVLGGGAGTATRVEVLRLSSSNMVLSTTEVGKGQVSSLGMVHDGTNVVVAWTRPLHLQVAVVSP